MRDLSFKIEAAAFVPLAVGPTLSLKLRITNADVGVLIQPTAIFCQMLFEMTHPHSRAEEQGLRNSFCARAWVEAPTFQDSTVVDLPIPCTSDFAAFAIKYLGGYGTGEIPPLLRFSGTALYADSADVSRTAPILWKEETEFKLPYELWRDMIDFDHSAPASSETLYCVPAVFEETGFVSFGLGKHCRGKAL